MPSSSLTPPLHHNSANRIEANASVDVMDIDDNELAWMECEEECVHEEEAQKWSEEHMRKIVEVKAVKRAKEVECKSEAAEKAEMERKA
jgi:hypothetical protein